MKLTREDVIGMRQVADNFLAQEQAGVTCGELIALCDMTLAALDAPDAQAKADAEWLRIEDAFHAGAEWAIEEHPAGGEYSWHRFGADVTKAIATYINTLTATTTRGTE